MRALRTLGLVVSVVVLAFAAAGCGGGGGGDDNGSKSAATEPSVWAASVCGALGNWVKDLQDGSRELGNQMKDTKDLKTVKARFVDFLENAEQSSQEMVDKVKDAGPPDLEQGQEIQDDLVAALEKVNTSFSKAVDKANELSTDSLQEFSSGVSDLSQDVQTNLGAAGKGFNSLKNRSTELEDATAAEPACQQFKSRS